MTKRKLGWNQNVDKTHCVNGHELNEQNTYAGYETAIGNKLRKCKPCTQERARQRNRTIRKGANDGG